MMRRILDAITGRSPTRQEADRLNIKFDEKKIEAAMDAANDAKDALVTHVSSFAEVIEQLGKDLGYVDKRKGRKHATNIGRSPKA